VLSNSTQDTKSNNEPTTAVVSIAGVRIYGFEQGCEKEGELSCDEDTPSSHSQNNLVDLEELSLTIRKCPVCGSKATFRNCGGTYFVQCLNDKCNMTGPWSRGLNDASARWNQIYPRDKVADLKTTLRKFFKDIDEISMNGGSPMVCLDTLLDMASTLRVKLHSCE